MLLTGYTPHLRGEARIEGKRVRRKTTFDQISYVYRFKEALDRAASVGDYRWLCDDPDNLWPIDDYLGGPTPPPPPVTIPAPAPSARRAKAGTWTLAQWQTDRSHRITTALHGPHSFVLEAGSANVAAR